MIQAENLTKYYSDLCAVDHINLDIQKGEILGLLGPNGAGKTTTLRMLTGFFLPTTGDIRVKDFSIRENTLDIKKLIGYLPESAPLYHSMLVYDYLNYVADVRGLDKEKKNTRIKKLADICGLHGIMHKTIEELSKGLKQRVGLAHAMMDDPEILVLDEPTSGLDPNQIAEIREIIKQIGKEKTVILSTHILSEAEATCDRIVIINKGKIVADGSTEALKQEGNRENIIHISLKNADIASAKQIFGEINGVSRIETPKAPRDDLIDISLTCDASYDLRQTVYRKIKETDWDLFELRQETKTLEHIFRDLTRQN